MGDGKQSEEHAREASMHWVRYRSRGFLTYRGAIVYNPHISKIIYLKQNYLSNKSWEYNISKTLFLIFGFLNGLELTLETMRIKFIRNRKIECKCILCIHLPSRPPFTVMDQTATISSLPSILLPPGRAVIKLTNFMAQSFITISL